MPGTNGYISANHYIFDQATGTQTIAGGSVNLPYQLGDIAVLSNAILGGDLVTNGLSIGGSGQLTLGGNRATVNGNFSTTGSALLVMTNPGDSLMVSGNAAFDGGLEAGVNLTEGTISIGGNLSQSGSQFRAQGNHRTVFASPTAVIASGGVEPVFNDLVVSGSLSLATNTNMVRDLVMQSGSHLVSQTTQQLRGARNVTLASGSTVTPFLLELSGSISSLGLLSPGTIVFSGTGFIPASSANVAYQRIIVSNLSAGYAPNGALTAPNGLAIMGPFTVGGNTVTVNDLQVSQPTGRLIMNNAAGVLSIATIASFDGGDETGQLTAGTILINGSMTQSATNSPNSFRASGTHSVFFSGAGASQLAFETPGSQFQNLVIDMPSGTTTVTGGTIVAAGNLTVSRGSFILNGHRVDVGQNLAINGSTSTIAMQNPVDSLIVGNAATFAGGSTVGLLTAGVLRVSGNFTQSATVSTTSFAPSGSHKTVLGSAAGGAVSIGSPGLGAAGSHFQVLDVTSATGGITLDVNMQADSLISTTSAARISSPGVNLTVRRSNVSGLTLDNTHFVLDEQGVASTENFSNVTFTGFAGIADVLLTVSGPGNSSGRPAVTTANINFQPLGIGAANFYVDLTSTNGLAFQMTMTGSNQGAAAGGNGPALTRVTPGSGVATVSWP